MIYVDLYKGTKVTKLFVDRLHVASILRIKVLSTFVLLQELDGSMINCNCRSIYQCCMQL